MSKSRSYELLEARYETGFPRVTVEAHRLTSWQSRPQEKLLGPFLCIFVYDGCLYWLNLWALFTVRNKSWVTRTATAQA